MKTSGREAREVVYGIYDQLTAAHSAVVLEAAGFAQVIIERGKTRFRFRATRT
jgi:hypothetical protein